VNRKRTYRLYREGALTVRRRKRERIGLFERKPLPKPTRVNRSWSMGRPAPTKAAQPDEAKRCPNLREGYETA